MSLAGQAAVAQVGNEVSNLRDILMTYNKITEQCFHRCAANFNYRETTGLEQSCVDSCAYKHINGNQRMMSSFMDIQTTKQRLMMEDLEKQQLEQQQQQQQQQQPSQTQPVSDSPQLPSEVSVSSAVSPQSVNEIPSSPANNDAVR